MKAVGNPIMITTTMRPSIKSPSAGSLMSGVPAHAALARRLVDLLRALDRDLARFVVDILAVRELLLDDVDLGDVLAGGSAIRRS